MKDEKTEQTKVIFRQWKTGCEIIALFPEIAIDTIGYNCQSYMRIGQHGAANPDIVRDTKPVKDTKDGACKDLIDELIGLGYNLKIVKQFTYKMKKIRMAMYK